MFINTSTESKLLQKMDSFFFIKYSSKKNKGGLDYVQGIIGKNAVCVYNIIKINTIIEYLTILEILSNEI